MTEIKFDDDVVEVDVQVIGRGLGIDASTVQDLIRDGKISSRHERGEGEDAGRARLTFFLNSRRFHIIVDDTGQIIRRSVIDFGDCPLPAAVREAGK